MMQQLQAREWCRQRCLWKHHVSRGYFKDLVAISQLSGPYLMIPCAHTAALTFCCSVKTTTQYLADAYSLEHLRHAIGRACLRAISLRHETNARDLDQLGWLALQVAWEH